MSMIKPLECAIPGRITGAGPGIIIIIMKYAIILCMLVCRGTATYWTITGGSWYCSVTGIGSSCVTDGSDHHGNNEYCEMVAQQVGVSPVFYTVGIHHF